MGPHITCKQQVVRPSFQQQWMRGGATPTAILPMPTLPHLSRDHEARECERVHRQLAFLESLRRLPSLDFPIIPLMARLTFLFFHHASIELMLGSVPSSLVFRPLTTLCCLLRRPPAFAPLSQTFEPPQAFGSSDCRFPTTHDCAIGLIPGPNTSWCIGAYTDTLSFL